MLMEALASNHLGDHDMFDVILGLIILLVDPYGREIMRYVQVANTFMVTLLTGDNEMLVEAVTPLILPTLP